MFVCKCHELLSQNQFKECEEFIGIFWGAWGGYMKKWEWMNNKAMESFKKYGTFCHKRWSYRNEAMCIEFSMPLVVWLVFNKATESHVLSITFLLLNIDRGTCGHRNWLGDSIYLDWKFSHLNWC